MKRRIRVDVGWMLCLALLTGAPMSVATGQTPDAEFKKIADAFSQAWAKGDAKAIAALHTKDAVRITAGQPAALGTAAIEKAMSDALIGAYKGTTLSITANKYTQVTPDVYVGEGTYEVVGGTPPAGTPVRGQYINTMVRQGGRWMIAASAVMPATQPTK